MLRFDFTDERGTQRCLQFETPVRTIAARTLDEVRPAMREVDRAVAAGSYAAGFVGYEAAPAFDAALEVGRSPDLPLVWFGVFEQPSEGDAPRDAEQVSDGIESIHWTADTSVEEYHRAIADVRASIARGDLYQANYTFRLTGVLDPRSLEMRYRRLLAEHRAPYSAYLDLGHWRMLSLSPELFFRVNDGTIITKPMKGTAARGRWLEDDVEYASHLAASEKDRAENVMIVDLMRNDLGRIAEVGSVDVTSLFEIERYPTVFQMVSSIEARLRPGTTLDHIFAALFPAGSITGAPKTSSMSLISRLERSPRGVYCGAIGFAAPGGQAVFNVAIRTAVVESPSGRTTFGIGGGVTWDSTAEGEYAEARSKAACLDVTPAFDLIETMRLESGCYVRREGHVRRLRDSAAYFDVGYDASRLAAALDDHAAQHASGTRRVRLVLSRGGDVRVESAHLDPLSDAPHAIVLAETPITRDDRFLYHKTTRRAVYDQHRALHPDAFDVLLWNEEGELTEFTIGNLVVEIDGQRWTPPRRCGLLAGVLRQSLLERGDIHERPLTREDLASATAIWRISSLRDWVVVTLRADQLRSTSAAEGTSATRSRREGQGPDRRTGS